ncbi:hypothetical protein LQW54_013327 [Pestalotiopsis sp. IQ-011]
MLNLNPGLKEITHSITGGSIMAQDSPSPKRDRKVFKSVYDESRHHPRHRLRRPFLGYESPYGTDTEGEHSPVTDPGISDRFHYSSIPPMNSHRVASGWAPVGLPPYDQEAPAPSPWLSAVPRITSTPSYPPNHLPHTRGYSSHPQPSHLRIHPQHQHPYPHPHHHRHHHHHHGSSSPVSHGYDKPASHQHHHHWRHAKRSADHIDPDRGYDGDESRNTTAPSTAATSPLDDRPSESTTLGSDKNAALLLMNLSVRDTGARRGGREGSGTASETTTPVDAAFPRIKRSRASSM